MELKKQEQDFQFSLWLIASILLHLLFILIVLFWYFERSLQDKLMRKNPEFKTTPLTPQQLQQQKEEEKKKTPVLWKDLKQPEKKEDLVYTLVPGRQAVTEAEPAKTESEKPKEKSLAKTKPEEPRLEEPRLEMPQHVAPQHEAPQPPIPEPKPSQKQEAPKPRHKAPQHVVSQSQTPTWEPSKSMPSKPKYEHQPQPQPKTISQRHDDIKEKILQEPKLDPKQESDSLKKEDQLVSAISSDSSKKIDTTNPSIVKKKVTLQDLQLGFAQYMQEGNNDILLQRGNTNQPPDAQALRLITYQQQLAHTMREAIVAHHQYHLAESIRGARPTYSITIDRSGKLVSFTWIKGSGSDILDKVMNEALQGIRLYPAVPQYVLGDTFSHSWTFMH